MNQKSNRFVSLDLMKTIGMLFVCCTHFSISAASHFDSIPLTNQILISRFFINIEVCCVPILFMTNGALSLNHSLDMKKHMKKMLHFLLQFFLWCFITIVIIRAFNRPLPVLSMGEWISAILFNKNSGIFTPHFWFMPCFLCISLLSPFIHSFFSKATRENGAYIKLFLFILFLLYFVKNDISQIAFAKSIMLDTNVLTIYSPFLDIVGGMLFYFVLGGYLWSKKDQLNNSITTVISLGSIILGLLLLLQEWYIIEFYTKTSINPANASYLSMGAICITVGIFLLIISIESIIENIKIISTYCSFIGKNTIGIYYIHYILAFLLNEVLLKGIYPSSCILNLTRSIVLITISAFLYTLLKKIPLLREIV